METDGLAMPQRRRAYLALAAVTAMAVLDSTVTNVALPTIAREMHVTPALSIWVTNAFQLALTAAIFTWSSFGQTRGLARVWRAGIATFTVGSLLCALSHSFASLVAARFLQGIGAAGIMSLSPALLRSVFPRAQLGRALGLNSLVVATGVAAGPTIGGAILAVTSWPWIFFINVPVGIVVVLATRTLFPPDRGHGGAIHVPSIVTSAVGFALIVYGIDGLGRREARPLIALELLAGLATFGWFLARQRHLEHPMFAVELYARPQFALSSLAGLLTFTGSTLAIVALPFLFQVGMGDTPLQSALLMTSWPLSMAVFASFAGRLSDRYPASVLATLGSGILAAALMLYAAIPLHAAVAHIVLVGALCGIGFGLFQAPNSRQLMGSAPREKSASAAAVMAASRVGGQTCGAAALSVVFAAYATTVEAHGVAAAAQTHAAVSAALWTGAVFCGVATIAGSARLWFPQGVTQARSSGAAGA